MNNTRHYQDTEHTPRSEPVWPSFTSRVLGLRKFGCEEIILVLVDADIKLYNNRNKYCYHLVTISNGLLDIESAMSKWSLKWCPITEQTQSPKKTLKRLNRSKRTVCSRTLRQSRYRLAGWLQHKELRYAWGGKQRADCTGLEAKVRAGGCILTVGATEGFKWDIFEFKEKKNIKTKQTKPHCSLVALWENGSEGKIWNCLEGKESGQIDQWMWST